MNKKENIQMVSEALTRIAKENPHRLIFGTDYGACNHESHIALIEGLPVDECTKELIFYKNAVELYKLSI
jgi:predicted TIM-barrel fold metal-dependent hydrolase